TYNAIPNIKKKTTITKKKIVSGGGGGSLWWGIWHHAQVLTCGGALKDFGTRAVGKHFLGEVEGFWSNSFLTPFSGIWVPEFYVAT
ncbi:hypothetical protein V4Y02_23720, partial [Escherichia coli]